LKILNFRQELDQKRIKEEAVSERSKLKEELDVIESKRSILEQEMTRLRTTAEHFQEKIASQTRLIRDARDQIGENNIELTYLVRFLFVELD